MLMLLASILWLGFAVAVGIGAQTRGRTGTAWFFVALVISPVLAGTFLLALPSLRAPPRVFLHPLKFVPEGVMLGVPSRLLQHGQVEAMLPGGVALFQNMDQFTAATTGGTVEYHPSAVKTLAHHLNGWGYGTQKSGEVLAVSPDGQESRFRSWTEFWEAAHG